MHIVLGAKVFLTAHVVQLDAVGKPTKVVLANSGGDCVDVSSMIANSSCAQDATPILD